MGYPMTYNRVVNRNGLADGNYGTPPQRWATNVNLDLKGLEDSEEQFVLSLGPHWRERLRQYAQSAHNLAGDLRRFEQDSVDESATCIHIATRIGIDPEIVAAVLKEFIAW